MIIPVRCFTCNNIIGNKWEKYNSILKSGETSKVAFEQLRLRRYCCKRMFLCHVEIIDKLLLHSKDKNNNSNEKSVKI